MTGFAGLLRSNRNYRYTWIGQVVSEVGDHYNNIAVFSLVLANTRSGLVVAGILLARGFAVMLGGPIAGVLLDRMDRKRLMITSDLVRAVIALLFIFGIPAGRTGLLYLLSGCLMFASPFFTSGRAAILPSIASKDELHTANSLTQLTQWTTLVIGAFLGGTSVAGFGYTLAFALGGIASKPVTIDQRIESREVLSVTISVDHDIVDGAPAARFVQQLKELIEKEIDSP